jgi:hypothetical protein
MLPLAIQLLAALIFFLALKKQLQSQKQKQIKILKSIKLISIIIILATSLTLPSKPLSGTIKLLKKFTLTKPLNIKKITPSIH